MAGKAVFLDRDNTVIEDPGYLGDPEGVTLLPGVELAMKSLSQAGYKLVIVTNQSGIARGLLTEEALEKIHGELRRQLAAHEAHVDAIYYCPYHPEGTVEEYARDSDLRKPKPGMLLKAAKELDLDLSACWMVGDSARDIEAGQRAGCQTVRVRMRPSHATPGEEGDEDVQADYTVRNLVDAARVILRSPQQTEQARRAATERMAAHAQAAGVMADKQPVASEMGESASLTAAAEQAGQAEEPGAPADDDGAVLREILRHVRQLAHAQQTEEFSFIKLLAAMVQVLALLTLGVTFFRMVADAVEQATIWALITIALQTMSLTLFIAVRRG